MRFAKLAMCDADFVKALLKRLSKTNGLMEDIHHLHKISVHQFYYDGAFLEVEIIPYHAKDGNELDCLFMVSPVLANDEVVKSCVVGSGWMLSREIEHRLGELQ